MSTRHLLLRRNTHPSLTTLRHNTTLSPSTSPTPPPPTPYDTISASINPKLRRLLTPDPRFLRYASPHPSPSPHLTPLLQFPPTHLTTLPNGLRVATQSSLSSRSAAVSVLLDSGSRFDSDHRSGVASFLERLLLGTGHEGAAGIGMEVSGFTGREVSGFLAKLLGKDLVAGVEALGHILQNFVLNDQMIDHVRQQILTQRDKMTPNYEEATLDQLHATAFQHTPLGRTIQGPVDHIESITKSDIEAYISSHCAAHRLVISASGAVKHEDVVELVKKAFTKLSANPATTSQLVSADPANFTGSEVRIIDDDIPLAHFAIAFEGASGKDADSIALMVMQNMLGSWSKKDGGGKHVGSQLVQMAAINEIAESIKTFNINYKDTGLFGIYAVAKPDCLDDLAYAIMHQISKLSYRVSDDDVIRARNQLKTSLLLSSTDGASAVSKDIGQQLLTYGRRIPFAELFTRIDAVDASTVKRVANRFLFDKDIAIAAMGPIKYLPDYNWFRRRTYWLRY